MPISETEKTGFTVNPIYWGNTYTIDNLPIQIIGYQGNKGIAQYLDGQKGLVGLPDNWTLYMGPEITVLGTSPKTKLQLAQAVSNLLNWKAYDNMTGEERYNAKKEAALTRREMAQIYSPEELNKWSLLSIINGVNSILKDPARNIDLVMLSTIAAPIAAAATAEAWPIVQAAGQWALSNPYINAALTSIGGAHAYNSIKNGSANAMTALELMPMVGLGSKLWNTGIRSIKGIKDGSSSYSPWAIVPKNFKPSPYGELKEVDLTKPEGLLKQKEYAKTFVEEVLIPRAQLLGIWNQEFVDRWNLMHPDIQLKSLGSSTWGFYNKNGIKLNDDNIPISTLLHELRHSFDANSSGSTNRNFFLRLLASNRIKGINNKAIELTPQLEDVIRNAYLVKSPSLKHKLKSFLERSSYYGDIEEMIATNTEALAALYNLFVKEGGMRAAPETFYEWIDAMDEMELVRRIEAGVKNGYWLDYKYYNTFDLLPENAVDNFHLSSKFTSQYQNHVIDWAKRLKKALKIPGLLPIIPAAKSIKDSTNNNLALGGTISNTSDSTILADNNNYILDFKGKQYGLPTVRYGNGGHLFKDGDTIYSIPTSLFSIDPTTGRSRNPETGVYDQVQVLPDLIVRGTSAQTKAANAKAINDLLYRNAYDGMTGEERYEAQKRAQNTALGLQLEKTPEGYSRIANEGMNRALTNMFKDPAKDLDKVMLGTLGIGVSPIALPEVAAGAATLLANPYVDAALTSIGGAHGINDIANGRANAMTALEVLPMARLAKPLWNAGKSAVNYMSEIAPEIDTFITSPHTGKWATFGNRQYRFKPGNIGMNGVPVESRAANQPLTITAENAISITPEQWTAAQDAAIARGDMVEAQRLRDLHFKTNAPNTQIIDKDGNPTHAYHGTGAKFTEFDTTGKYSTLDEGYYGKGAYFAPNREIAQLYADTEKTPTIYDTYLNIKNPLRHVRDENADLYGKTIVDNDGVISKLPDDLVDESYDMTEFVATKPNQIKLADAVTYKDGVRIPLGERDNFNINDIRYGLIPLGIGATGYGLYDNFDSTNSDIHSYGGPLVLQANMLLTGGPKKNIIPGNLPAYFSYDSDKDEYISDYYSDEEDAPDIKWYRSKQAKELKKTHRQVIDPDGGKIKYVPIDVYKAGSWKARGLPNPLYDDLQGGGFYLNPFENEIITGDGKIATKLEGEFDDFGNQLYETNDGELYTDGDDEFSLGGNLFGNGGIKKKWNTTSGMGYIPSNESISTNELKRRMYDHITPTGYLFPIVRTVSAISDPFRTDTIFFDTKKYKELNSHAAIPSLRDDIYAEYLLIPKKERHKIIYNSNIEDLGYSKGEIETTNLKPKNAEDTLHYRLKNLSPDLLAKLIDRGQKLSINENTVANVLGLYFGSHTIGHGMEDGREYVSYYDKWNLSPFTLFGKDLSFGLGKPVHLYDRIYLDDYHKVPHTTGIFLPEVEIKGRKYKNKKK